MRTRLSSSSSAPWHTLPDARRRHVPATARASGGEQTSEARCGWAGQRAQAQALHQRASSACFSHQRSACGTPVGGTTCSRRKCGQRTHVDVVIIGLRWEAGARGTVQLAGNQRDCHQAHTCVRGEWIRRLTHWTCPVEGSGEPHPTTSTSRSAASQPPHLCRWPGSRGSEQAATAPWAACQCHRCCGSCVHRCVAIGGWPPLAAVRGQMRQKRGRGSDP